MLKILSTVILFSVTGNDIVITDAWIRPASEGTNTALFFEVTNNGSVTDTLYAASSDLAEVTEVHETYKKEGDMMGMRHVDFVEVKAGATVKFKPRDLHIMLIKLKKDLAIDDKGEVTLHFKKAGKVKVTAVVTDMPKIKPQM